MRAKRPGPGRPPGKRYELNLNLPISGEMMEAVDKALKPDQKRVQFIRDAIAQLLRRTKS